MCTQTIISSKINIIFEHNEAIFIVYVFNCRITLLHPDVCDAIIVFSLFVIVLRLFDNTKHQNRCEMNVKGLEIKSLLRKCIRPGLTSMFYFENVFSEM